MSIWEYCIRHLNFYLFGTAGELLFHGFVLGCQVSKRAQVFVYTEKLQNKLFSTKI